MNGIRDVHLYGILDVKAPSEILDSALRDLIGLPRNQIQVKNLTAKRLC
jgi:hypothetical protein